MEALRLFADVFTSPGRGLPAAAARRSFVPALLAATLASLIFAAVLVPRIDFERLVTDRMGGSELTPHQLSEAVATARKLGAVSAYGGAVVGAAGSALVVAFALWLGFRVAGARPGFVPSLAVSAFALLPKSVEALATIPAVLQRATVDPQGLGRLQPWTALHWVGEGVRGPAAAVAASANLFSLWTAALLGLGMAAVAGVGRARAFAVVGVLWALAIAAGMAAAGAAAGPG